MKVYDDNSSKPAVGQSNRNLKTPLKHSELPLKGPWSLGPLVFGAPGQKMAKVACPAWSLKSLARTASCGHIGAVGALGAQTFGDWNK